MIGSLAATAKTLGEARRLRTRLHLAAAAYAVVWRALAAVLIVGALDMVWPWPTALRGLFLAAGIIELTCRTLIVIGLCASPAALLASGEMAFAFFIAHFSRAFWPFQNGGDTAVLNCFLFLYVAARGAGMLSIDSMIGKKPGVLRA